MRILFQGDSITDAGRDYGNDAFKGRGFPTVVSARLGYKYPGKYEFINRGVSGNRVVDLYSRIKIDFINLKPDVITILIGVNDVWHEFWRGNGVDAVKFERVYGMLIEEIKEALGDVKIVILEPFTLDGSANTENYASFRAETELRAAASARVAEKYGLPFIPLQKKFDDLAKVTGNAYWLADGVHPTDAGHGLIADELISVIEQIG